MPLLPPLPPLRSVPPSPPSPSGIGTGDPGVPQALGHPGWVAGGAGTELGGGSGFAHAGEGQERQSEPRVPSLAVSHRERSPRGSLGLCPHGKGDLRLLRTLLAAVLGAAPQRGPYPWGRRQVSASLCGSPSGARPPRPTLSPSPALSVGGLSPLRWPKVPFPQGLGCPGVSAVAVASLQAWKPLGEASELQNEVAPCFSVSKRKRRCGKL